MNLSHLNSMQRAPDAAIDGASPFAAPAQTAPAPAAAGAPDYGDTSYLDNTDSREPLVKQCTVPATLTLLEAKENDEGKQRVVYAVQLYGENMVHDNGTPVPQGKRILTTVYLPIDTPEKRERSERKVLNIIKALNNIPLDGRDKAAYAALPPQAKLGWLAADPDKGRANPKFSLHALEPGDKHVGVKVMAQVAIGKDMDGNPRNEVTLLAASTKPSGKAK